MARGLLLILVIVTIIIISGCVTSRESVSFHSAYERTCINTKTIETQNPYPDCHTYCSNLKFDKEAPLSFEKTKLIDGSILCRCELCDCTRNLFFISTGSISEGKINLEIFNTGALNTTKFTVLFVNERGSIFHSYETKISMGEGVELSIENREGLKNITIVSTECPGIFDSVRDVDWL